ncbi:hypothetical protein LTR42_001381 [Elasticomyces elasticus]|nr:hypothetical protein LTR42_001381 [Elasticomyces elasticus]
MPLVYSTSKAVLILDNELEADMAEEEDDIQMWLRISAYHRRYWTLQEAALARALYAVHAKRVFAVEGFAQCDIPRWQPQRQSKDHPLTRMGRVEYSASAKIQRDHRLHSVWNALIGKTSTKRGELHAILANLLDISARRILALPQKDRMKAIIKNYERLPLDMVFSASSRTWDSAEAEGQVRQYPKDEDRWVPQLPGGVPIEISRDMDFAFLGPRGLSIPSPAPGKATQSRLMLFEEDGRSSWQGLSVLTGQNLWVETLQMKGYEPPLTSGPAFYLLHTCSGHNGYTSRGYRGTGARLILQDTSDDENGNLLFKFVFDCSVIFGDLNARNLELDAQPSSQLIVHMHEPRPSILLPCDSRPGLKSEATSWRTIKYVTLGLAAIPVLVIQVKKYQSQVHNVIWRSSFRLDYEPSRPWCERLDEALRQHGTLTYRQWGLWAYAKMLIGSVRMAGSIKRVSASTLRAVSKRAKRTPESQSRTDVEMAAIAADASSNI